MIEIQITGMDELIQKVGNTPNLIGQPLRDFFNKSTLLLQREAQIKTPVDTGRLRASEMTEVDSSFIPQWGKVGTNVYYGIFVEEDTRPHFPPPNALVGWGKRHGISPYALAHTIRRRGTKGRHMFRNSLTENMGNINSFLMQAGVDIETEWGKS